MMPFSPPAAGSHAPAAALPQDSAPARPYDERGARAEQKQSFRDGGRHQNGVSIAPHPTPTDGAGLPVSRPPTTMPMSRAAGLQPPSDAISHEAAARSNDDQRPRDGAAHALPRAASAMPVRPRDVGRRSPPRDDATDRPRSLPVEARREGARTLPAPNQRGQQTRGQQTHHNGGESPTLLQGCRDDHGPVPQECPARLGDDLIARQQDGGDEEHEGGGMTPPSDLADFVGGLSRSLDNELAALAALTTVSRPTTGPHSADIDDDDNTSVDDEGGPVPANADDHGDSNKTPATLGGDEANDAPLTYVTMSTVSKMCSGLATKSEPVVAVRFLAKVNPFGRGDVKWRAIITDGYSALTCFVLGAFTTEDSPTPCLVRISHYTFCRGRLTIHAAERTGGRRSFDHFVRSDQWGLLGVAPTPTCSAPAPPTAVISAPAPPRTVTSTATQTPASVDSAGPTTIASVTSAGTQTEPRAVVSTATQASVFVPQFTAPRRRPRRNRRRRRRDRPRREEGQEPPRPPTRQRHVTFAEAVAGQAPPPPPVRKGEVGADRAHQTAHKPREPEDGHVHRRTRAPREPGGSTTFLSRPPRQPPDDRPPGTDAAAVVRVADARRQQCLADLRARHLARLAADHPFRDKGTWHQPSRRHARGRRRRYGTHNRGGGPAGSVDRLEAQLPAGHLVLGGPRYDNYGS